MFIDYEICLTFPCIFLGRKSNLDYVPTIAKVKSVSSQLSSHKAKKKSLNALDRMSRRLKRTQERNQLLLTQEKCKNESIIIEEQDENVIDKFKSKNCALEEQIDYLKNQLQSLPKRSETLEYEKRNDKQRIEELEGERKNLLKLSNDCQSEYKLLKSNYDNINYKSVVEDENKLYFYTRIPTVAIFDLFFNFVENSINQSDISKLTKKETFMMILMRLGLLEEDFAYRFGISLPFVSRILHKWLPILAIRLSFLVTWPRREELRKTLPACFRESFPKCSVIIDCFEISIEKPSDLTARAQTYFSYKSHNTVKIFVGITPQGTISSISKSWGGRVSDVYLRENCGLLKNLLPGDLLLADRGFSVHESVGLYCAQLKIPEFTHGKSQLEQKFVDETREVLAVRIHVDRVIGLLRNKFTILEGILPIKMIMKTDYGTCKLTHILTICSALCNLCSSVIPVE